ncbi:MAG: hypothetical protein ACI8TP_000741 [Acidimicrobiales bacterium]|jgi:hypothetical protein
MLMYQTLVAEAIERRVSDGRSSSTDRWSERGSGVVEWLGISALSIGVLVALFAALEGVGLDLIAAIRGQLGV